MKLNVVVLSIKPKLTTWAPLGALTQKRTVPVVTIEPLNIVPVGSMNFSCVDENERMKVGTVTANAGKTIPETNSTAINAVQNNNVIFFIFPLDKS